MNFSFENDFLHLSKDLYQQDLDQIVNDQQNKIKEENSTDNILMSNMNSNQFLMQIPTAEFCALNMRLLERDSEVKLAMETAAAAEKTFLKYKQETEKEMNEIKKKLDEHSFADVKSDGCSNDSIHSEEKIEQLNEEIAMLKDYNQMLTNELQEITSPKNMPEIQHQIKNQITSKNNPISVETLSNFEQQKIEFQVEIENKQRNINELKEQLLNINYISEQQLQNMKNTMDKKNSIIDRQVKDIIGLQHMVDELRNELKLYKENQHETENNQQLINKQKHEIQHLQSSLNKFVCNEREKQIYSNQILENIQHLQQSFQENYIQIS